MNKERLLRLARDILPNVPEENFKMITWKCGTSACAVGWAASDPQFNEEGFELDKHCEGPLAIFMFTPWYEGIGGWSAVENFFGIDFDHAQYLFSDEAYSIVDSNERITKEQVIQRIEEFVAGGGAP